MQFDPPLCGMPAMIRPRWGDVSRVPECKNTELNDTPSGQPHETHKPITKSNRKVSKHTGGGGWVSGGSWVSWVSWNGMQLAK